MTGEEALEAVARAVCESAAGKSPHHQCGIGRESVGYCLCDGEAAEFDRADAALKALKLSWDQAAALMSGEAEVAEKRVVSLGRYWFEHGADASEKEHRSTSDQIAEYLSDPRSEIDAASEKETP